MTTEYLDHMRQRDAYDQLGELLTLGQRNELPTLSWRIAPNGVLTGEVDGWRRTTDDQRTVITTWAKLLRTEVQETEHTDGITRLYAPWDGPDGKRAGCIRAELLND